MDLLLTLTRFNYAPDGTFGKLRLPDGSSLYTVEPPWKDNEPNVSCIPDGLYDLALRKSPKVFQSSGGKYSHGYEILGVPGRQFCMIHPANWPHELDGCIAPGLDYRIIQTKEGEFKQAVTSSRAAFVRLMNVMQKADSVKLYIKPFVMEYQKAG
uniref:DUF5675 family protein n=1 Tax=Polynucleobacter sp. TaxID=2029855 RepID=UPI004048835D